MYGSFRDETLDVVKEVVLVSSFVRDTRMIDASFWEDQHYTSVGGRGVEYSIKFSLVLPMSDVLAIMEAVT